MKRGDVCYGMLRAAACVDELDHHALMYVLGGREAGAAEGEGGCCCASAIAIAHMQAHRARGHSTRLGGVALTGGPVCV